MALLLQVISLNRIGLTDVESNLALLWDNARKIIRNGVETGHFARRTTVGLKSRLLDMMLTVTVNPGFVNTDLPPFLILPPNFP
jgi:hypothetical protein